MKIDVQDNQIAIDTEGTSLSKAQEYQLGYWLGRAKSRDESSNLEHLGSIVQYLEKQGLDFELSDAAQEYLQDQARAVGDHMSLLATARDFKDGNFDVDDFNQFTESLDKLIQRQLKDHQQKAAYHLSLIGNGANFSVPGSGKTSVVLSHFQKLREEQKVNTLFVVGPVACFQPWQDEYEAVLGKKPKVKILSGLQKDARLFAYLETSSPKDLYLITFQTLLNDAGSIKKFLANRRIKSLLVIDEAHYMKKLGGDWANAVLSVAQPATYRCVLTGTPIPRSYMDLWNLMEFLWLDNNPIQGEDRAKLQIYDESHDSGAAIDLLDDKVGPLFYRVRKSDLGLKPQTRQSILIPMNKNERRVYDAIVTKIRAYSRDDYVGNIDLIRKLQRGRMMRIRQSLSYTKLLTSALDDEGYNEDILGSDGDLGQLLIDYDKLERPAKMDELLLKIRGLQNQKQKVVVWSNFIGTIDFMLEMLNSEGIRAKKITGQIPAEREGLVNEETREKIREEFIDLNSGLDVLIANPAACAESISLHKTCHHAIYYDLSYNLAQYLQSMDRIHRVGGSEQNEAHYDFLLYEDTIDTDILESLDEKADKMSAIVDKDYSIYSLDMSTTNEDEEAYERLFGQNQGT